MFSASAPLYLIGRIAVLFENQPNYAGRASMVAMQVISLAYMVIVFLLVYLLNTTQIFNINEIVVIIKF